MMPEPLVVEGLANDTYDIRYILDVIMKGILLFPNIQHRKAYMGMGAVGTTSIVLGILGVAMSSLNDLSLITLVLSVFLIIEGVYISVTAYINNHIVSNIPDLGQESNESIIRWVRDEKNGYLLVNISDEDI